MTTHRSLVAGDGNTAGRRQGAATTLCARVRPEERRRLEELYRSLGAADLQTRFAGIVSRDHALGYVDRLDLRWDVVVALRDADGQFLGVAELLRLRPDGSSAEIAFVVAPGCRGLGLASELMRRALESAGEHGIRRLLAQVCTGNAPMLAVFRRAGADLRREDGEFVASIDVRAAGGALEAEA